MTKESSSKKRSRDKMVSQIKEMAAAQKRRRMRKKESRTVDGSVAAASTAASTVDGTTASTRTDVDGMATDRTNTSLGTAVAAGRTVDSGVGVAPGSAPAVAPAVAPGSASAVAPVVALVAANAADEHPEEEASSTTSTSTSTASPTTTATAAAATTNTTSWACLSCTYHNAKRCRRCTVCNARRPTLEEEEAKKERPVGGLGDLGASSPSQSTTATSTKTPNSSSPPSHHNQSLTKNKNANKNKNKRRIRQRGTNKKDLAETVVSKDDDDFEDNNNNNNNNDDENDNVRVSVSVALGQDHKLHDTNDNVKDINSTKNSNDGARILQGGEPLDASMSMSTIMTPSGIAITNRITNANTNVASNRTHQTEQTVEPNRKNDTTTATSETSPTAFTPTHAHVQKLTHENELLRQMLHESSLHNQQAVRLLDQHETAWMEFRQRTDDMLLRQREQLTECLERQQDFLQKSLALSLALLPPPSTTTSTSTAGTSASPTATTTNTATMPCRSINTATAVADQQKRSSSSSITGTSPLLPTSVGDDDRTPPADKSTRAAFTFMYPYTSGQQEQESPPAISVADQKGIAVETFPRSRPLEFEFVPPTPATVTHGTVNTSQDDTVVQHKLTIRASPPPSPANSTQTIDPDHAYASQQRHHHQLSVTPKQTPAIPTNRTFSTTDRRTLDPRLLHTSTFKPTKSFSLLQPKDSNKATAKPQNPSPANSTQTIDPDHASKYWQPSETPTMHGVIIPTSRAVPSSTGTRTTDPRLLQKSTFKTTKSFSWHQPKDSDKAAAKPQSPPPSPANSTQTIDPDYASQHRQPSVTPTMHGAAMPTSHIVPITTGTRTTDPRLPRASTLKTTKSVSLQQPKDSDKAAAKPQSPPPSPANSTQTIDPDRASQYHHQQVSVTLKQAAAAAMCFEVFPGTSLDPVVAATSTFVRRSSENQARRVTLENPDPGAIFTRRTTPADSRLLGLPDKWQASSAKPPLLNSTNHRGASSAPLVVAAAAVAASTATWTSNAPARNFLQSMDQATIHQGTASAMAAPPKQGSGTTTWTKSRRQSRSNPIATTSTTTSRSDALWEEDSNSQPNYAYKETVRCKTVRQGLPCHDCNDCRLFYDALRKSGHEFSQSEPPNQYLQHSRHRARFTPPETPVDFWEIDFIDEKLKAEKEGRSLQFEKHV